MSRSTKPIDFYPPLLNHTVVWITQQLSHWIGHWYYRMKLEVSASDLASLSQLQGKRVLLLSNHPTFHDWIAIFLLSARSGDRFHYLAAYERFKGLRGRWLQWLGAYSIRRGLGDRPSVAKTLELMMQPHCRLVVFPEGGCSFQNDTVMPFRPGAIQVALQAINKAVKQGESITDFYVVPVSLKYVYTVDMTPVIENTLHRLERALALSPRGTTYERLRSIAEQVLITLEKDYNLHDDTITTLGWNDRIPRLKHHVLEACEHTLGIRSTSTEQVRERVYRIQYILESNAEQLAGEEFWTYNAMHRAAARLLNFDAIYDGYVADHPTPERFLETLTRLERAVFHIDQPPPKGYRRVLLRVGEPLNLNNYFADYQRDRTDTIATLTRQVQQIIQHNLDALVAKPASIVAASNPR
jgi:hypothetical protein